MKEGEGGVMDGKIKESNTGGGSSEGKGDRWKGVEGGVGRISLGAMKEDDGTTGNGDLEDGTLTPVGRCFRTNLSSSAGMHPS
jgi:hypothetical protein